MPHVVDDLVLALGLADQADAMTMAAFSQPATFMTKEDGTPVTETDRAVEVTLRDSLRLSRPLDGFLGEETGLAHGGGRCWIVDPIDGTRSFVAGGRAWATQIALEEKGRVVLGVTSAPALGSRWWGAMSVGAFRSAAGSDVAEPIWTTRTPKDSTTRWSCHPPFDVLPGRWRELAERLTVLGGPTANTSHPAIMVAEGELDLCLQLEGAAWDYGAFAGIVQAAGGRFSYLDDSVRLAGVRPALFSNGSLHATALALLNDDE